MSDGKTFDPHTGNWVMPDGRSTYGPPVVDAIWHNMYAGSSFITMRRGWDGTMDELVIQIAKAVENGVYRLVSLNATAYTVVVVCATENGAEEWEHAHPGSSVESCEKYWREKGLGSTDEPEAGNSKIEAK